MGWPLKFLTVFAVLTGVSAQANNLGLNIETMAKAGFLSGTYTGRDANGQFDATGAIELEGNLFTSPGSAWAARSVLALDVTTSRARYFYTGVGQRFFFGPHGFASFAKDGSDTILIRPKIRYLIGYDLGLSQVLVIPYGTILGSYATTADVNASVGARYSIDKNISADATLGFGMGTGIATMNVTTFTWRALLGFVYAF